ncbi:hypothetical protein [Burkholderia sp. BCC1630]|uniref:hypothetical protein n=1 Tax=Burkholderia sp. BCC1630 TaxID=2676304 RepID=UPI00158D7B0C|nr:hypothetical protein [Burkholderia sp. BCC1630]
MPGQVRFLCAVLIAIVADLKGGWMIVFVLPFLYATVSSLKKRTIGEFMAKYIYSIAAGAIIGVAYRLSDERCAPASTLRLGWQVD